MSNHLAIATITETLANIVRDAAGPHAPGLVVTTGSLSHAAIAASARVDICLYQVRPNAELRNTTWPTATGEDAALRRNHVAVELNYLVSFHGPADQLIAQQLLAHTVMAFDTNAVLSREQIQRAVRAAPGGFLNGSDLAEHSQRITLSALTLSLDELATVCTMTQQSPFALSVAYQCAVVLGGR